MGLGGYILWTPVAREYYRAFGRRVYFTNRVFGRLQFPRKVDRSALFTNNPYIVPDGAGEVDELRLDNREANYWNRVTRNRIDYKPGGHAVEIACAAYGIHDPEIRCELFLTEPELQAGRSVLADLGPYVAVEPHTKDSFTVNKQWGFERWQAVVDRLRAEGVSLLQVGEAGKQILEGVKDATGRFGIRETGAVLRQASLLLTPEGGLMHLANAVGTRCVVVYGGYVSPGLTGYPENINLYASVDCAPCGLRRACLHERRICMDRITVDQVVDGALQLLKEDRSSRIE
ncbi:MAG: hypothetical protein K9M82_13630 [Deltaproteobacteria bacterium]|nr:hypothetical protein [Deltaproteobacteria bacterium]